MVPPRHDRGTLTQRHTHTLAKACTAQAGPGLLFPRRPGICSSAPWQAGVTGSGVTGSGHPPRVCVCSSTHICQHSARECLYPVAGREQEEGEARQSIFCVPHVRREGHKEVV